MLTKQECDDFRVFLRDLWEHLRLPEPTRVQYAMASRLQHGPGRDIIMVHRGAGKSWVTAAYVLWRLARHYTLGLDSDLNILVMSQTKDRAVEFSQFTQRIISDWSKLGFLRPRAGQRQSVMAFDVGPAGLMQQPSVKAAGAGGQITGSRADVIVADDIETPQSALTQLKRERMENAVREFDAILKPDVEGEIKYLGTPQCEESLYNKLPERGYSSWIWPARYPDARRLASYGDRLSSVIERDLDRKVAMAGEPTDPTRFDERELIEREQSWGKAGFSLQFLLDTSLSDLERYPLRLRDFIVHPVDTDVAPDRFLWDGNEKTCQEDLQAIGLSGDRWYGPSYVDPHVSPYHGTIMAVDPAGKGRDRVGYAVVKGLNGYLHLPAWGTLPGGYEDPNLIRIARIAQENKVSLILIEPQFGGGMFAELLRPVLKKYAGNVGVEEGEWSSVQKERRIADVLEPLLARHRIIIDPRLIRTDFSSAATGGDALFHSFAFQLSRLTRERGALRFDDAIDALAQAVSWWTDRMAVDVHQQAKQRRDEELDETLRRFLDGTTLDVLSPGAPRPRPANLFGDL